MCIRDRETAQAELAAAKAAAFEPVTVTIEGEEVTLNSVDEIQNAITNLDIKLDEAVVALEDIHIDIANRATAWNVNAMIDHTTGSIMLNGVRASIEEVIDAVYYSGESQGWAAAVETLDLAGQLATLRGVGFVDADDIAALVQDAKDVNNWKALQAAIDANSNLGFGQWIEGADLSGNSEAGFTVAYNGTYGGFSTGNAHSIQQFVNDANGNPVFGDAATFIVGNGDLNGDNVLQENETGIVIYTTNDDIVPLDTKADTLNTTNGYSQSQFNGDREVSNYVTIDTGNSVEVILATGHDVNGAFFDIFDGVESKLEAYVEGYKDDYDKGYDDGFTDGYDAGWNDRDNDRDYGTTGSSR